MASEMPTYVRAHQDAVERGWFTAECSMTHGGVDYGLALALAEQVADGMACLHSNNIMHGVRGLHARQQPHARGVRPACTTTTSYTGCTACLHDSNVVHGVRGLPACNDIVHGVRSPGGRGRQAHALDARSRLVVRTLFLLGECIAPTPVLQRLRSHALA